jgi:alcohol dehydrogenase class IV
VAGRGSLSSINKEVVKLGGKRVLLLTDAGVQQAGLVEMAKNALADFSQGVYDKIPQDPDLEAVDEATEMARRLKADCIVSVGGGSVIDTAKAVCVTLKNGGTANEHLGMMLLNELQTPHIVIPTTSGTGSEVTSVAVITSKQAGRKLFLVDPYIIPNTAILDPRFTTTMPKGLTVSTGMDAMTHAIEALTSIMSNEICDAQALHAIRLINTNLPVVIEDGKNEQARLNMQIAATMAGWAFTVAQVGLAHGMAHTLGSLHHIPHGAACGVLIPKVMRYNVDNATDKLALIAQAMGIPTDNISKREAALAAADAVEGLMRKVGHPLTLNELGVSEEDLALLAYHALADTSNFFNARPVSDPTEIMQIYKDSMVPPPTRNF